MRVVFFGSIPVARECLELVLAHPDAEVVGVCATPLDSWRSDESVWNFAKRLDLPLVDHEDIPGLAPDLGVSVRYHRILRPETIGAFPHGIVNTHGGLLPEYRGSYCNIQALVNGDDQYGVALHYIEEGVDTGAVVDQRSTPIGPDDTGLDLYLRGERLCVEALAGNLDGLLAGTATAVEQDESRARSYRRQDVDALREIPLDALGDPRSLRIIRALDSPHHEPAFTIIEGRKVYLRVTR